MTAFIIGRREFITLLGGAVAAWPLAARAQQPERMRRIGVLMMYAESDGQAQGLVAVFREGLRQLGWMEDHNIRLDYRWATSDSETIQRFAKELVALQPDLIFSSSTPTTALLLQQTRTIPIIFANIVDPVGSGFVESLPRPGGNVTGFLNLEASMTGKWLELLKEIAPRVARVAIVFNPSTAPYAEIYLNPFKTAAASLGMEAIVARVRDMTELDTRASSRCSARHSVTWGGWRPNIRLDYRWATTDSESIQQFAKELVALQPDLILSSSTPTTASLLQQTRTIPIIFANIVDPVGSGFVVSLPRPGGDVTGFLNLETSMTGKWLELLKEIAPRVARVAIFFNPSTAPYAEVYLNPFKAAAASLGVEAIVAPLRDMTELDSVIAAQARYPNGGLIAMPDGFMFAHHAEVASLAGDFD